MKVSVKHLLGHGLFASHLDAVLLRNAAVVVAFHRVQEADVSDSLSVDVRSFEQHCRFFARHFKVLPLRDLVYRMEHGLRLNRHLAITFDDGYRDNFEIARPVLEKLSLPATFFVVTGWIGTEVVPWWDSARGVQHPWMTWNDVRSLHRKGFEVGAHTQTHVDLGTVSDVEALKEVLGSRLALEQQIAAPVESFAYPYGRRENLTDTNRAAVKAAGFRCCCSGFGGINVTGTDPFRLRRVPISPWHVSSQLFGFEVAFGRSVLSA